MNEDERAVLLRWIGHADMDSETLSALTEENKLKKKCFFFRLAFFSIKNQVKNRTD